jgi:hypothetical protein
VSPASAVEPRQSRRETGHPHHHCEVAAHRTLQSLRRTPALDLWVCEQVADTPVVPSTDVSASRIAILRLAPKASPPV